MRKVTLLITLGIMTSCAGNEPAKIENNIEQTAVAGTENVARDKEVRNSNDSQTIELAGYVFEYNESSKSGCFFVDPEMVGAGVATDISGEVCENCHHVKYGNGANITFSKVPSNENYTKPQKGVLIIVTGYWNKNTKDPVFYVQSFDPFF